MIEIRFFIQVNKGVKFDLDALRSFLVILKSKYVFLDDVLIEYFINVFDLSAKKNSDGTWNRAADQVQWFKKYIKGEVSKYALPAKYTTEDGAKVILQKDFLTMDLRNKNPSELLEHLENWFKYNQNSKGKRRKFFPVSSNKSKSIPWVKGQLYDYAKPFFKLISYKKIEKINNFSSRLTGEGLDDFNEKNYEIVDEVWIKLVSIFKEIFDEITGGSN